MRKNFESKYLLMSLPCGGGSDHKKNKTTIDGRMSQKHISCCPGHTITLDECTYGSENCLKSDKMSALLVAVIVVAEDWICSRGII